MKIIKKLKQATFLNIKDKEAVHLDFNPFIEGNQLQGSFVLLHWNRLFRRYGFYVSDTDCYFTHPAHLTITNMPGILGEIFPSFPVLPTACIIFPNAIAQFVEDNLIIEDKVNA